MAIIRIKNQDPENKCRPSEHQYCEGLQYALDRCNAYREELRNQDPPDDFDEEKSPPEMPLNGLRFSLNLHTLKRTQSICFDFGEASPALLLEFCPWCGERLDEHQGLPG